MRKVAPDGVFVAHGKGVWVLSTVEAEDKGTRMEESTPLKRRVI